MPVTSPAPGNSSSYTPCAASAESSRKGEPGSSRRIHPLAHQQFAGFTVLVARRSASAQRVALHHAAQFADQGLHGGTVGREFRGPGV